MEKTGNMGESCGSGELTLSRMTCEKHDYKSIVVNHALADYTDQCESITTLLSGPRREIWLRLLASSSVSLASPRKRCMAEPP